MKKVLIFLAVVMVFFSCEKQDVDPIVETPIDTISGPIKWDKISGSVQKGPFLTGTDILISELNSDLSQTGRTFSTLIIGNDGTFEVNNVELSSQYVFIKANGFYFNEVSGKQSTSQITLFALSDLSDKSTINVNLLSHLEKFRVEYLISEGSNFNEAKIQAQREILNMFKIDLLDTIPSELLNIANPGEYNAALLAVSCILQGYRTESELNELLTNIGMDLRTDGELTDLSLGSKLMDHALYLDTTLIRNNLSDLYESLEVSYNISDFGKYIKSFIDSSDYEVVNPLIKYPATGSYGTNLLDLNLTSVNGWGKSVSVNLKKGTSVKIKIFRNDGGSYSYSDASVNNWEASSPNNVLTLSKKATDYDVNCDMQLSLDPGQVTIEYYEMNSLVPTYTKNLTIQ